MSNEPLGMPEIYMDLLGRISAGDVSLIIAFSLLVKQLHLARLIDGEWTVGELRRIAGAMPEPEIAAAMVKVADDVVAFLSPAEPDKPHLQLVPKPASPQT